MNNQNEPYQNLGGYQNVVTGPVLLGDMATFDFGATRMTAEADDCAGMDVRDLAEMGINIYRKLPVAKQGGDPAEWKKIEDALRGASTAQPPVNQSGYCYYLNNPAYSHFVYGCTLPSATPLPTDAAARKRIPIASGFCDYFPRAMAAVAEVSRAGNEQHNPGSPLHWDRSKSGDESDALMRHFLERGTLDTDGLRHSAKLAWRAMALLEKELEQSSSHASD